MPRVPRVPHALFRLFRSPTIAFVCQRAAACDRFSGRIQPSGVKKAYRRSLILVHTDRHQNTTGDIHFIAEQCFEALNIAYKAFEKEEMGAP